MDIFSVYAPIMKRFRGRRFALFRDLVKPLRSDSLLDVGGYPGTWTAHEPVVGRIDCLNIDADAAAWDAASAPEHHLSMVAGNGCDLAYRDRSYDIVFSNSVIEHVGGWREQQDFAREVRRVGDGLWIQTPAFECPIEPHFIAPLIHYLPVKWRYALVRWITPWGWLQRPDRKMVREMVDNIRLLTKREFSELFPDCEILTERMLGVIPKSYVAYRKR